MKKNKKHYILCLLVMLAGIVLYMSNSTKTVFASESNRGITIRGIGYDLKTKELELEVSRDDGENGT